MHLQNAAYRGFRKSIEVKKCKQRKQSNIKQYEMHSYSRKLPVVSLVQHNAKEKINKKEIKKQ